MRGAGSLGDTLEEHGGDEEPCSEFLRTLCQAEIEDDRKFGVTLKYGQSIEGGQLMPPYREIYFKLDLQVALMTLIGRRVAAHYYEGICNLLSGAYAFIVMCSSHRVSTDRQDSGWPASSTYTQLKTPAPPARHLPASTFWTTSVKRAAAMKASRFVLN